MEKIFYVYALIDPRDNKIFYIGRGKNKRAFVHTRPSLLVKDTIKNSIIKSILAEGLDVVIDFLYENLDFESSNRLERETIVQIGKSNLTNLTKGGQGVLGVKGFLGKHHSPETRKVMSDRQKGSNNSMFGDKWHRTEEGRNSFLSKMSGSNHPAFGKKVPEERKERIRSKLVGIKLTYDQKEQRRQSMKDVWEKRRNGTLPLPKNHPKLY